MIKTAMRQASGLLASGQSPSTNEQTDYLALLNTILDQFNARRSFIYQIQDENFTWPASTTSRTIGASANFNTVRPVKIEGQYWVDSSSDSWPIVQQDFAQYDAWPSKSDTAERPNYLFYDPAYAQGVLYLTPIPTSQGTLHLRTWKVLSSIALVSDSITLPPGYELFLTLTLAKYIARENGQQLRQDLLLDLKEAESVIKTLNRKPGILRMPPELVASSQVYDIRRG
jgi:hypothetical protein